MSGDLTGTFYLYTHDNPCHMSKWIKYPLVFLATLVVLFGVFFCYVYFSVDNRVTLENPVASFSNTKNIQRLDSVTLPPDSVTRYITALLQKANVHGLAVSIVNNQELVYQQYFGLRDKRKNEPFTPGTIWYGASLSKTILADVALQLAAEGLIHLDTPLYRYLVKPLYTYRTNSVQQFFGANYIDYNSLEGDGRYKKITARMCLAHTSGFPNWRWLEPDQKLKIKFEPGTKYSYSGEGLFLLQVVMEEITGKDFEELAIEKIFVPLEMNRSSFVWQRAYEGNYAVGYGSNGSFLGIPKRNVPNGAGSLSTTLEEYTRYFQTVLMQQQPRYKVLTSQQIRIKARQQFGPDAQVETNENDSIRLAYGLGYGLYETPYGKAFFKEGHLEGWQHYAVGIPAKGNALILMSNSDNAESIFKELIEYTTGNTTTPWYWEGYIPFDLEP
jgi:D-alanyl-D-alanine-carboxypeptidase/D-alanyl-D-alanine-endopeptidase